MLLFDFCIIKNIHKITEDKKYEMISAYKQALKDQKYKDAKILLRKMYRKWPRDEVIWLAIVRYCEYTNNGRGIHQTLNELKKRKIRLSPKAKKVLSFWEDDWVCCQMTIKMVT